MSFNIDEGIKKEYEEDDLPCQKHGIVVPDVTPILDRSEAEFKGSGDEDEIKIEYEESGDQDPLAEEYSPESSVDTSILPSIVAPLVEINEAVGIKEVERRVPEVSEDLEAEDTLDETKGTTLDSALDENLEDTSTWYKTIDKFGKLICNFCDRSYSTLTSLRYHVNIKHSEQVSSLKSKILQKRRSSQPTCHLCKKRFKLLADLKLHIEEHNIENIANSCRYCNAVLRNNQELIYHLNSNHNILQKRLHVCNICGYRTHKLSHLKQHSNTHLQEKLNKCTYCDYSTNHKSNLKNHERIHTRKKPYICDFKGCGSCFTDLSGLRYHKQKHYPDKNILHCDKCSYTSVYEQSLKVHIQSHMRK